ncbi:MAG TPA: ATP-binding protein [Puia sp.]|jgi:signal transduction histidine kinase
MRNKVFLIFIVLSLSATPALTQPDSSNGYSVQHFTDENGLPQNSINDMLFDNDGYLWLASQVGLVRFNGRSFKLFYPNDKPIMESNILYLGKDHRGIFYFQTDDHNLYTYPGNNSPFMSPVITPTEALKRPLLLNAGKQLYDFSVFLNHAGSTAEASRRKKIFQYLFQHNRNFFAADTAHLYLIYSDSLYYYDSPILTALSALPGNNWQYLLQDKKFYVLKEDSVMAVYSNGRKTGGTSLIEGDLRPDRAAIKKGGGKYRLYSCRKTTHLLAGNRLYLLTPAAGGRLTGKFLINLDFIPNISAVEYNSGLDLLLVATRTEGFYFLRKNHFQSNGWPPPLQQKITRHLFGPMALNRGREILTDKFIFTPRGKLIPIKDTAPIWQRCLHIDKKDQVWAAFYNLPRRLDTAMRPLDVLPALDANIVDYTEDAAGHLYCLTERSLWQLDTAPGDGLGGSRSDSFRRLFTIDRLSGREANESVAPVGAHRLWIAGTDGLLEYDLEKKEARRFPEFRNTHVRTIHICADGNILVGTYGQGYFYYYHNRFFRMPLDRNQFLVTAHCFLEDSHGYVWIPSNKGLFKVPKADMDAWCEGNNSELYYYYYGRQDGLLTNEFNGGFNSSGVITPEGFVALLSMKGMVCFYTDSLATDFPHGSIDMTHLDIDGASVERKDTIRLKPGYNSMSIEISCPYLGNPNNLYLQYNLEGLGDEWTPIAPDGIIMLNRLAAGKYTLRVRKVNGFGKNNYQYRQWTFIVPPYFYRTTWFILLLALGVLIMFFFLVQLRLKLVEKKKEIRVKAEKLRGAVVRLEETVTKLQQSEQELLKTSRQREKLISLVIHDLRSPLRFLTLLAGDLHDNQASLSLSEMKDRTYWVKKGTQDIYNFSEDFLLWVTSQSDNFSITKRLVPLKPLLQEIDDFFREQVLQKGNNLSVTAADDQMIYSDPHVLITIIRNLVDNANKYTNHGNIHITASQDEQDILISVADTGRGMSPQQVAAFLGNDNMDNVKSGSQLGHKFIFDLTQRLDGTLTVESTQEKGTTVLLRFPGSESKDASG